MFTMKADGVVFYDPSIDDVAYQVIAPRAKYELNKADSLKFTLPPENVMHNGLRKMKTIVTLEQDGEEIFRGRVLETVSDLYNMNEVTCEGELGYLLDSLVRPYKFEEGKASDLFRQLVEKHNEQVDDYKRFEVGIITAIDDEDTTETESEAYSSTLSELRQMLVSPFEGYLRVRMENGVRYLDYLKEYDEESGQAIEFGVNLVDIENTIDASNVFSVLVPLGGYNTKKKNPITIADVNDGKDYLEDAEAIAKYGRIVKTYKWEELTDPQEIKDKGLEHFAKMKAERTLVIKAVDFHIIDKSVDSIRIGDKVKLLSSPHGLDETEVCSVIDLDIAQPENSEYTFGEPRKTMTDDNASTQKKNAARADHFHRWLTETENSFDVYVEAADAQINLNATQINEMGERVSSAEVRISGAESAITAKADVVRVEAIETQIAGLVTMEEFESLQGYVDEMITESMSVNTIVGGHADFDTIACGQLNGGTPATQAWVNGRGFLTELPSNAATQAWVLKQGYATTSVTNELAARIAALEAK